MKIQETRILKLQEFVKKVGSAAEIQRQYGVDASYLSQILNKHRPFGEKSARKIELACKLAPFYFDEQEQLMAKQDTPEYEVIMIMEQMSDTQKQQMVMIGKTLAGEPLKK